MQVYRMTSDPTPEGRFRWDFLEYLHDGSDGPCFPRMLTQPGPKAAAWRPFPVRINRRTTGDFFFLSDCWLAATPRSWEAVRTVVGASVEALPLDVESGEELLLLNVLDRVPLADGAGVSRNFATGHLSWVYRFAFREDDLVGRVIFKACEFEIGPYLVAPVLKAAVESAGLKGVGFRDLN